MVDEVVAANYVGHDPGWPELIKGPEGFKQWLGAARTLLPDFHITVDDLVSEGDRVAGCITMQGTHQGELPGFPRPTGKYVSLRGIFIRRLENGQRNKYIR